MTQYAESSIRVLKGLEPVRERPGMYTRTQDPTHILQEVIDNAADEALAGHAASLRVTLFADGSAQVEDDGRGIPVGIHPEEGVPTVELVFTRLHAGGKFDKQNQGAYAFSGGLHGVGVSVTNALSKRLEVEVCRGGRRHFMAFADGNVAEPLRDIGPCRGSGTRVRLWPDGKYFDSPRLSLTELERTLRAKAVLLAGVDVLLRIERAGGDFDERRWRYAGGLTDYLAELAEGQEGVAPVFAGEVYHGDASDFAPGEGAAWALSWYESGGGESYVNLIPTPAGGTHESGLKAGVFEAVKSFAEHHGMLPRGVRLQSEDVWSRVRFVLSVRVLDPQFQGQTKERLTSREVYRLVSGLVRDPLELWLNEDAERGRAIAEVAIRQAMARNRAAQKVTRRRSSGVAVLPGKLSDCESEDVNVNELFLVEGDSAGGSAKMARDKHFQAILPLRGKVLNSWEVETGRLFENREIHDIAVAIGVDPHGPEDAADLSGLRYGKIAILSDADVDGAHIQVLLLTLFFRHYPRLVDAGRVYIAQPPLYRIDVPAQGKKRPARKLYALDEAERVAILDRMEKEGFNPERLAIQRFKGLGEMNPDQLRETTLHPDTRRLIPVNGAQHHQAVAMFTMLMGRRESGARRQWMEDRGHLVEADI